MGKMHRRLNGRHYVFCSMLCLRHEHSDPLFHTLALGDVPRDLRCTYNFSGAIYDRRDRQRNVKSNAVLPHPDGFVMVNALASTDAIYYFRFFVLMVRWDENGHRPADGFLGRVAE